MPFTTKLFLEAGNHVLRASTRHHTSRLMPDGICLIRPSTCLNRDNQYPDTLSFSVTPSLKHDILSTGISTCYPSTTPFGLALGSDLPWAESPGPGTLRFSAGRILASLIATYATISSCDISNAPHGTPSSTYTMLLYHYSKSIECPKLR